MGEHRGDSRTLRTLKRLLRRKPRPLPPEEAQRLQDFKDWAARTWRWGR